MHGDPGQENGPRRRFGESKQARELRILNAIAEALNSTLDVQQALERTLVLVADLLGLHTGWIWLLDPETQQFYSAAVHNLPPYLQAPVQMTGKPCWCIQSFQKGQLTPKNIGVLECSRLRSAVSAGVAEETAGLRYHASIPLLFQDRPLGIMNVTGPAWRKLTRTELRLLSTIAYQVGIAIERARLAAVVNLLRGLPAGQPLAAAWGALARAFPAETGVRVYVRTAPVRPLPLGV